MGFTSFFESCYEGEHAGHIVEFQSRAEPMFVAAGVWGEWVDRESGEIVESFAIITTKPSGFIESVGHDRSPLFLAKTHFSDWLSESKLTCEDYRDFLIRSHVELKKADVKVERPLKSGWEKRK